MSDNKVLIDADFLVYSVGFSTEKRYYLTQDGTEYKYKADVPKGVEVQKVTEPGELRHTLGNVKITIQKILEACSPCLTYKLFLTGKGNFRETVATIQKYKGNRDNLDKPTWYEEIRSYLIKYYQAEVIDGYEADDACCWTFCEDPKNSLLAACDKDYRQIPNLRMYNTMSKEMEFVDTQAAQHNFYTQVLTGDVVDNISGAKGIGKAKATKILNGLRTPEDYYKICLSTYNNIYGSKGQDYLEENCSLLYLLRSRDDKWKSPVY